MECDTGYHVHGLLVQNSQNVLDHTLFVVIPDEDADLVRQACFFHLRIQIIFQVGFGLFRCPYAAVPGGSRYGLVLQAQHRHRDSLIEVCLQIFYDVFCPASVILRFQAAAVVSLRNLFRNRHSHCTVNSSIILCDLRRSFPLIRRRPRAHQNTDRLCGDFDGFFQHRKDIFAVAVDREGCQIRVCDRVCDCLILLKGIVTAVDRHADKSCMKAVRSENILQGLILCFLIHTGQQVCAALGHGAAEALDGLELKVRIQVDDIRLNHFYALGLVFRCQRFFPGFCFPFYMVRCNLFCFHFPYSIFHMFCGIY